MSDLPLIHPQQMSLARRRQGHRDRRFALAGGLSWSAGFVDAVGYIALYRIFVANMSGNTIALGLASAQQNWTLFLRRGSAIAVFVAGMLISKWGIYLARRKRFRFLPALVYGTEAVLLGLFVAFGTNLIADGRVQTTSALQYYFLIALPSFAMGLQNAMHTHFGPFHLHTTHVTGTLARLTDELAKFLAASGSRVRHRAKSARRNLHNAAILAGLWISYGVGAGMGVFLKQRWQLLCFLFPIAFLIILMMADFLQPMEFQTRGENSETQTEV